MFGCGGLRRSVRQTKEDPSGRNLILGVLISLLAIGYAQPSSLKSKSGPVGVVPEE